MPLFNFQRRRFQRRRLGRQSRQRKRSQAWRPRLERLEDRRVLAASFLISEFSADNSLAIEDEDGDSPDWIEIHNAGDEVGSLVDHYLTDSETNLNKWGFPDFDMQPGDYLVVFASQKDRTDPNETLHTNFNLNSDGEYLALTHDIPDPNNPGLLTQEVVHGFVPSFPQQTTDVAFGIPTGSVDTTFVSDSTPVEFLVPSDNSLGLDWTLPAFQVSGNWSTETAPVGFEVTNDPAQQIADSQGDWSTTGIHGENNWTNGYYNETTDGTPGYQVEDFQPFPRDDGGHSPTNYWTGLTWDWYAGNPPWTFIDSANVHPNGSNNGNIHWAIRRWESTVAGDVDIDFHIHKVGLCGSGVRGEIWVNGVQQFSQAIGGTDTNGYTQQVAIQGVNLGDSIDIAILPHGTDGSPSDPCDTTAVTATISGTPSLASEVATDVGAEMHNVNSSAYLRYPFQVANAGTVDSLNLNVQYDAGFVAFLNGVEVAASNAPAAVDLLFDSAATIERSDLDALQPVHFAISDDISLLQNGDNVLTIQLLNSTASDGDVLFSAELIGSELVADVNDVKYFVQPTPGAPNGDGVDTLGPIVANPSHTPTSPLETESLVITTEVTPTFHAVSTVDITYRIMFGAETTIAMVDDGTGDDAVASDGIFTATIPASAYATAEMVRWYFTSTDDQANAMRWPLFISSTESDEYLGTMVHDPSVDSNLPVIYWFVEDPNAANNRAGTRGSFYYLNEFYDNVQTDLHGQSTAGFPKKSYDVDFNRNNRFLYSPDGNRVKDINLLSNYADKAKVRNTVSYEILEQTGGPYHFAFPVRVQQNGQFFSVADMVEDGDDRYLERLGLDPLGALYKMYNTMSSVGHATSGAEKKTQRSEPNDDLTDFLTNITGLSGQDRTNYIFDHVNVPEVVNFMVGFPLTANTDCCHKNYYIYNDTNGTGEWQFLPWDYDLTLGHKWRSGPAYFDDVIYSTTGLFTGSNNGVLGAVINTPGVQDMYVRRLRTLMDEIYQEPGTPVGDRKLETRLDELVALIDPNNDADPFAGTDDADLDYQKWGSWSGTGAGGQAGTWQTMREAVDRIRNEYLEPRRNYLYGLGNVPAGQADFAAMAPELTNISIGTIDYSPTSNNQDEEYIQIVNSNNTAVDLSGWRLNNAVDFTFQAGTVIPANSSLYVSPNVNAFRARATGPAGGQGLFIQGNYSGHLSSFGETIELLDPAGGEVVSLTYQGDPSGPQQFLRITEINYNPTLPTVDELISVPGVLVEDFEFIELINTATEPLNINGVSFTDGIEYVFGNLTLAAGERILLVQDQQAFEARYGAGHNIVGEFDFGKLNNDGETIQLEDPNNNTIQQFDYNDSSAWPQLADGRGATLQVVDTAGDYDSPSNWRDSVRYQGTPGGAAEILAMPIVINEVLSHTDLPLSDTIELYNPNSVPVPISGWFLSDSADNVEKFAIPALTELAAGQYISFDESQFNSSGGVDPQDFALDGAHGDQVYLVSTDAQGDLLHFVDIAEFGSAANGESFGRWPNGTGDFLPMISRTFDGPNSGPRSGPVVISEIMYQPQDVGGIFDSNDLEFVEIQNTSNDDIDLENWQLRDGVSYNFPAGQMLLGNSVLVVLSFDPSDVLNTDKTTGFRDHYGIDNSVILIGGYSGSLNDSGETIQLMRPDSPAANEPDFFPMLIEDTVTYSNISPWVTEPAGTGSSLTRVNLTAWGEDAGNFGADGPTPGSALPSHPTVVSLELNAGIVDSAPLPGAGPLPTTWAEQRSDWRNVTVEFSETINSITPADIVLTNLGIDADNDADTVVVLTQQQLSTVDNVLTISIDPFSVPEGVYLIEIQPTVTDVLGLSLDGDGNGLGGDAYSLQGNETNNLYRLTFDQNGDAGVSVFDFSTFSYWFGTSVPTAPDFVDVSQDGGISVFDFTAFSLNFGVGVIFPVAFASTLVFGNDNGTLGDSDDMPDVEQIEPTVADRLFDELAAPARRLNDGLLQDIEADNELDDMNGQLEDIIDELFGDVV